MDTKIDFSISTPADYSVMVKNIPRNLNVDYKKELYEIFSNFKIPEKIILEKPSPNLKKICVEKIVLIYDIEKLEEIEKKIDDLVKEK